MSVWRSGIPMAAFLAGALASASAAAQPGPRTQLADFSAALDLALRDVTVPATPSLLPDTGTRGYYLPGYGAVFVAAPRLLAVPLRGRFVFHSRDDDQIRRNLLHIERGLERVQPAALRERLRRTLSELREADTAQLRSLTEAGRDAAPIPLDGLEQRRAAVREELSQARQRQEEAERDARAAREGLAQARARGTGEPARDPAQMEKDATALQAAAHDAEQRRAKWAQDVAALAAELERIQRQAARYRQRADRARLETDRRLDQVAEQVHVRLGVTVSGGDAEPPETGSEPSAGSPEGPPSVPWSLWFAAPAAPEPSRPSPSSALIPEVRRAVARLLHGRGAQLSVLGAGESVVVAVDFLPPVPSASIQTRTVVLRAHKSDLDAASAGRLSPESLGEKIELTEY